jgi:hypothetical protein
MRNLTVRAHGKNSEGRQRFFDGQLAVSRDPIGNP